MDNLMELKMNKIAKYENTPPKDAVVFSGYPRQQSSEKDKLLLVHDPLGTHPFVLEFKIDDVLYVEEIPSAVTEAGEGVPLVKLWIRKGAHGMLLEPFEVCEPSHFSDPKHFAAKSHELRERFHQHFFNHASSAG